MRDVASGDRLGLGVLDDGYAAPTRLQILAARLTDDELIDQVRGRIGRRVLRFSPDELAVLARLERAGMA